MTNEKFNQVESEAPAPISEIEPVIDDSVETPGISAEVLDVEEGLRGIDTGDFLDSDVAGYGDSLDLDTEEVQQVVDEGRFRESWDSLRDRALDISGKMRVLLGRSVLSLGVIGSPVQAQAIDLQQTATQERQIENPDKDIEELSSRMNLLYEAAKANPEKEQEFLDAVSELSSEYKNQIIEEIMSPDEAVRIHSAKLRKVIEVNVGRLPEFQNLGKDGVINLGDGVILIKDDAGFKMLRRVFLDEDKDSGPEVEDMLERTRENQGGITATNKDLERVFNKQNQIGLSDDERKTLDLIGDSGVMLPSDGDKIVLKQGAMLFTYAKSYTHEMMHKLMIEDKRLLQYWTTEWNNQTKDFKQKFVSDFDYLDISDEDKRKMTDEWVSDDEVMKIAKEMDEGIEPESKIYHIIQEFFAYSTDNVNDRTPVVEPGFELPGDPPPLK